MIHELSQYDVPFDKVETTVMEWANEAIDLAHHEAGDPDGRLEPLPPGSSVYEMQTLLYRIQVRASRVSELQMKSAQLKARAVKAKKGAAFAATRAFDEAMRNNQNRRVDVWTSKDERVSDASLDSFEQKRLAFQAEKLVDTTELAHSLVNNAHWFLEGLRRDVRASIQALQFVASLGN